jgi:hypothetical protein
VYDIESLVQWPDPRQRGHTSSLNKDLEIFYDEADQGSNWTSPTVRNCRTDGRGLAVVTSLIQGILTLVLIRI